MSTTQLAPEVSRTLQQFARRKFRLQAMRVLCVLITALIPAMAMVAFVDWGWVLNDRVRWLLSGSAYGLSAIATWILAGRKLFRKDSTTQLAAQLETTDPDLRQKLQAAVELSTDSPADVPDSATFRGLLQQDVQARIDSVTLRRSLPVSLMKRWLRAAVVVIAAAAVALTAGGPRLRNLAVRAMLPMANVDRVSRIQVDVLQPTPHSQMIPREETVAVVIATSGGDVEEAILETRIPGQEPVQTVMRPRAAGEFAANLHVDAEEIEYRILAGDAVTRRYTIQGRHRPMVSVFDKTFHYPKYSRLADEQREEQSGDLIALDGSTVDLRVTLNQAVSAAELRVRYADNEEQATIPLTEQADGRWQATVPVEQSALYQVHLVSAETGFDNPFSPRYEIRPIADLVPRAGFVNQQQTQLLLPPNDILALEGMAEDDLPLDSLQQEISVNGAEWVSVPLETTPATATEEQTHRIQSAWNWDLLGLELKTGDQITTRLVATDLLGHRGDSVPLQIIVSAPDFDPDRHQITQQRTALLRQLEQYAATVRTQQQRAEQITKQFREAVRRGGSGELNEAQTELDIETLRECATRIEDASLQLLNNLTTQTAAMPPGTFAWELDLSGRLVARIGMEFVAGIRQQTADFLADPDIKVRRPLVASLNSLFERARDDASVLASAYQHLVSADILAALATDMQAIRQQQELVQNAPPTFERLRRLETVVLNQLQNVARFAEQERHNMPDFLVHHMNQLVDWAGSWEGRLDDAMESVDRLPELQRHVRDLAREINDRQRYNVIDGGLPGRLTQSRHDLDARSGTLMEPIRQVGDAVRDQIALRQQADAAEDSQQGVSLSAAADRVDVRIASTATSALEQLKARRRLSQARLDSDRQFAADAGLAHRAVSALLAGYQSDNPPEFNTSSALYDVARAYRVLETGHDFANMELLLGTLMESERWNALKPAGQFRHPADWEAITSSLDHATRKLPLVNLHGEVVHGYQQLRWAVPVTEADRKLKERRWQREQVVSASSDLRQVQQLLTDAHEPLHVAMAAARAVIARYAPTIPELAREIASDVRQLEEASMATADELEQPSPEPATAPTLEQLQREQQRVNEELDMLRDALVEDANQQDLSEEQQRERARDADTGLAMIEQEAAEMNRQLQQAQQAATPQQAAEKLADAAEQQERTASTLEQIAAHFERMDAGEDVTLSRDELRQAERDMGIARQLDQQFTPVNQPEVTADARSQLQELEQELKRNPAMQEALSEIAEDTVREAANALQDAARQEQEIQKANERSDQQLQEQKNELQKSLRDLGEQASRLGRTLVNQAESTASQAKTPEAKDQFERARQRLQQAANTANSASNGDLLADLQRKAGDVQKAIEDAATALQQGRELSDEARSEPLSDNPRTQQDLKRNAETQQKRIADQLKREADQEVRRQDQLERQAAANVRNAERNEKNFAQQLKRAEQQHKQQPDNAGLENRVQQLERQLQQAQDQTESIRQRQQQAQQAENEARAQRAELNKLPGGPLNDKNPMAQLSERLADEAQRQNDRMREQAAALAEQADAATPGGATSQQLAQSTQRQKTVQDNVAATAARLERAARHEARLQNEPASEQLQQQAGAVRDVADNEVQQAGERLQDAAKSVQAAEANGSPQQQQTQQANQAVAAAEAALQAQAGSLEQLADANANSGESPPPGQGSPPADSATPPGAASEAANSDSNSESGSQQGSPAATPPSGQPFSPAEAAAGAQLAQTLDALDRQLNAESSANEGSSAVAAQLAAASASMAQQRALRQAASQPSKMPSGFEDQGGPGLTGPESAFRLTDVNRRNSEDWGQLRARDAADTVAGRRTAVSEEYRQSVEAYFRVLSERARRQSRTNQ